MPLITTCKIIELDVEWFLAPQGAIVVENGDTLLGRHEIGATWYSDRIHEIQDSRTGGGLIPKR
jgi:hypothetical protein